MLSFSTLKILVKVTTTRVKLNYEKLLGLFLQCSLKYLQIMHLCKLQGLGELRGLGRLYEGREGRPPRACVPRAT